METLNLYQNNVAYDFEMFAPSPKPEREAPIIDYPETKAKDKLRRDRNAKKKTGTLSAFLLVAFLLVALFANVLSRAQISQAQMQITRQQNAISKLDSEITRLECNLQSLMTYETIEAALPLIVIKIRFWRRYIRSDRRVIRDTPVASTPIW